MELSAGASASFSVLWHFGCNPNLGFLGHMAALMGNERIPFLVLVTCLVDVLDPGLLMPHSLEHVPLQVTRALAPSCWCYKDKINIFIYYFYYLLHSLVHMVTIAGHQGTSTQVLVL